MFDHAAMFFNSFNADLEPRETDTSGQFGTNRQVWTACQELQLDEEVTTLVMERHRGRDDDALIRGALEFAATPGWSRGLTDKEATAQGIPVRHVALAMRDYVRAIIFVATNNRLPFQPE